ncbi:MAG: carboxypeptidase regulatory-like domain-containing protein, partial [Candidatus Rokubacteria bacterium]|nr:carboxypeptidase regulatory-like domain-containing protein [Candidatus Rokubacteria bacterium]
SWLDLRDEAVREFEWVVAHAPGDSEEAKTARQWLADNRRRAPRPTAAEPAADDPAVGDGGLRGTVMWAEPGQASAPQGRQQLVLAGLPDTPTAERIYIVRADRQGQYEFKRIVPGPYRLKGEGAGGRTRWRLKVVLEPGQDLELDLAPENGIQRRDDFPEGR